MLDLLLLPLLLIAEPPPVTPMPSVGPAPMLRIREPFRRTGPKTADKVAPPKLVPRTPAGLAGCEQALMPTQELPRRVGEVVRYLVAVDGLSVGTVDFKVEQDGTFQGLNVTEFRSLFKLDALVATFLPVEGRAAALVPYGRFWPMKAMDKYQLDQDRLEEELTLASEGRAMAVKRVKNNHTENENRAFAYPIVDFVSGFYLLRALPKTMNGCAVLYGNHRAYTVWLAPDGSEKIKTPVGMREADRYQVRYASEKSPRPLTARVWIGDVPTRLPFRVEMDGKHRLEAQVHLYESGGSSLPGTSGTDVEIRP